MAPKILFDLFLAHKSKGLSGIPQETRYLFLILSKSKLFKTVGLLPTTKNNLKKVDLNDLLNQSKFLFNLKNSNETTINKNTKIRNLFRFFLKFINKFRKAFLLFKTQKSQFPIYDLHQSFDPSIIWRLFFDGMVDSKYSLESKNWKFALSELNKFRRKIPFFNSSLKTQDYKFAVFEDLNYIECAPTTIPIIRYHDGIPVLSPDLISSERHIENHYLEIKKNEKKAFFVCNSPCSLDHLKTISPIAAQNAVVIPCPVNPIQKVSAKPTEIFELSKLYLSKISKQINPQILDIWEEHFSKYNCKNKYILTLSNLEPKKNHCKLVEAWLKLRQDLNEDIKLIIIGSFGWDYENIVEIMSPHISNGNILHLEKIPEYTKPTFFSFATCFVFPSLVEGFGIPPIEAQMCELPTIVSDIPALRYSCGDGAIYFNPYDPEDIAKKIKLIFNLSQESKDLLLQNATKNTERFSEKCILKQWEDFFSNQLKKSSL